MLFFILYWKKKNTLPKLFKWKGKKLSPKTICELAYGLLEPNILVLYVSQKKKWKRKEGRKGDTVFKYKARSDFFQSRGLRRGKVFLRMKQSAGPHSTLTQDWSQELSQNFAAKTQALLMEKCVPEPVLCKSRHVVYSIYTLSFWHIYLSWAKKQFSEELRKTGPWVAKKKEV